MTSNKVIASIATLLFIGVIVVNALANALPINGLNTGQVSALYPSRFTPAGITFSIWSVIYLLLAGFVIFQWRNLSKPYYRDLTTLFIISCIINISWILVWHHLLILTSVIIMLLFLFVLIRIFLLLQKFPEQSNSELVLIHLPFTVYLAWISVATIANIAAYFTSLHWQGTPLSPTVWTILMMTIASLLAITVVLKFYRYAFAMVVMWALAGIALYDYPLITPVAVVLIFVLIGVSLFVFIKTRRGFSN